MQVNEDEVRALPGVTAVVKLPNGVGVIAGTVGQAFAARDAIKASWSAAPASTFDSEAGFAEYEAVARDLSKRGVEFTAQGDVDAALAAAARRMSWDFRTRYVYHAQLEPLSATVAISADGKSVQVWCGVQGPSAVISSIAQVLAVPRENVVVHQHYLGGAYGRRSQVDVVVDAALLAKAAGQPVKLIWSREDDIRGGRFRPATVHRIDAGLDGNGRIVAWRHRVVCESVIAYTSPPARLEQIGGKDHIIMKGSPVTPYDISAKRAEFIRMQRGVRLAPLRGVGVGHNLPAIESFIDDIAAATGKDPLAIRLELTAASPRANLLLRTVAEMSDWTRPRTETALGIAVEEKDDSLVAGVAEIALDRTTGKISVRNLWAAIDCGVCIQPRNVEAQIEGGMIFGLGHVLREEISIREGRVQQSNFDDYPVMRMEDVPVIKVQVIRNAHKPTGVGEAGVPIAAAAVVNAFRSLTGIAPHELPLTRQRVLAMLSRGRS